MSKINQFVQKLVNMSPNIWKNMYKITISSEFVFVKYGVTLSGQSAKYV